MGVSASEVIPPGLPYATHLFEFIQSVEICLVQICIEVANSLVEIGASIAKGHGRDVERYFWLQESVHGDLPYKLLTSTSGVALVR